MIIDLFSYLHHHSWLMALMFLLTCNTTCWKFQLNTHHVFSITVFVLYCNQLHFLFTLNNLQIIELTLSVYLYRFIFY